MATKTALKAAPVSAAGKLTKKKPAARKKANSQQMTLSLPVEDTYSHSGYSTEQVVRILKITLRKVDHWTQLGLVEASVLPAVGSGSARYYNYSDILEINLIQKMRDAGIGLEKIKENFAYVRRELKKNVYNSVFVFADGQPAVVGDEKELFTLASKTMKTSKGQGILNLNIISLPQVKREVDNQIEDMGITPAML